MENNKKKLQIPSTCALLFMLMIVCTILTWIVPAGEFDTEKVGDLNKVIAGTYHTVEASPRDHNKGICGYPEDRPRDRP